jgi:cyclopropane fatty-acyl-phospholipid synthase-like methyltransferase
MKASTGMTKPSRTSWNAYWSSSGTGFQKESFSKKRIIAILDRYVFSGATVLDAGCGSGFFSSYFLSKGCVVDSLDYSERALSLTRKNTGGRSRRYLAIDLLSPDIPLENGLYDCIFTDGLFEHFAVSDQNKMLSLFQRKKKQTGFVITFVPNRFSPWQLIRPFFMPGIKEEPFSMEDLVAVHGAMEIVESGGINVLPICASPEKALGAPFGMLLYCVSR